MSEHTDKHCTTCGWFTVNDGGGMPCDMCDRLPLDDYAFWKPFEWTAEDRLAIAAPELMAALIDARDELCRLCLMVQGAGHCDGCDRKEAIDEAIAKAGGCGQHEPTEHIRAAKSCGNCEHGDTKQYTPTMCGECQNLGADVSGDLIHWIPREES